MFFRKKKFMWEIEFSIRCECVIGGVSFEIKIIPIIQPIKKYFMK